MLGRFALLVLVMADLVACGDAATSTPPVPCDRCSAAELLCTAPGVESASFARSAFDAQGCTYSGIHTTSGEMHVSCDAPADCASDAICSGTCSPQ